MKISNHFIYGLIAFSAFIVVPCCSNEEKLSLDGTADATYPLNISISNSLETKAGGGVISGAQFPDGSSLGLFLTKEDGTTAYDTDYSNVQYTSSTVSESQVWTASSPILLTATKANVYAYYPYDVSYTNITSIPVDVTEDKDVMWATHATNVYNASPVATLPMNHALAVIRLSLSKGDYSGTGALESITIQGDCLGNKGTLNAKDGTVTITESGSEIDLGTLAFTTLTTNAQEAEQLVIPTTTSGSIKVTINMDGKTFEATSNASISTSNSNAYKFGLTFSDSKLTMSTVSIGTIVETDVENMTPLLSTLSWSNMTAENDGVYGIKADGSPIPYDEAITTSETLSGVAIVMYGRAMQISNNQLTCKWGTVDISLIPNHSLIGGGVTTVTGTGYLIKPDGTYGTSDESTKVKTDYTAWPNFEDTALVDTAGWAYTEAMIVQQFGNASFLGPQTQTFRENESVNQGYQDWWVPTAGQIAYIYLNMNRINELFDKCGGTQLSSALYWSCSEYDASNSWCLVPSSGLMYIAFGKNLPDASAVFLRDL